MGNFYKFYYISYYVNKINHINFNKNNSKKVRIPFLFFLIFFSNYFFHKDAEIPEFGLSAIKTFFLNYGAYL